MLSKTPTAESDYSLHNVTADYEDFTPAELDAFREDLQRHGLRIRIVIWRDQIVDGRHRDRLCRELGIERSYDDISERCPTEEDMRKYVGSLNHRRRARTAPLTNEEKRMRVEAELKADPSQNDVVIAKMTGTSQPFAWKVRKDLEATGGITVIPPEERKSRTGKVGEGHGQRLGNGEARTKAEAELKRDPARIDRVIAEIAGVSCAAVFRARKALEQQGAIEIVAPAERRARADKIGENTVAVAPAANSIDAIIEKRERIAAAIRDNPDKSTALIARELNVYRGTVHKIRQGFDYSEDNRSVRVPGGKTLSSLCREGMQMEATGQTAEIIAPKIGIGLTSYRFARDLLRLADNSRLNAGDAKKVRDAVDFMDKHRRPKTAMEQVRDIATRVWGDNRQGHPRDAKREQRQIDRYIHTIDVLSEAAEQAHNAVVPYLDQQSLELARGELNQAATSIKKAIGNLEGAQKCL